MLPPEQEVALAALQLPLEARKSLIVQLLESLRRVDDEVSEEELKALWDAEIDRREREFEAGRLPTTPWSDIKARLAQRRQP